MSFSRRRFLQRTSASLLATSMPSVRSLGQQGGRVIAPYSPDNVPPAANPDTHALAARALDAARAAGAQYAEAHHRTREQEHFAFFDPYPPPHVSFGNGFGVRALYNGYWGYAAVGGTCSPDDAVRVGREAVGLAKNGARGKPRVVELAPAPVTQGTWSTPIEIDPFTVSWEEKIDFANAYRDYIAEQSPEFKGGIGFGFYKRQHFFTSTEGASLTQTLYLTTFDVSVMALGSWPGGYVGETQGQRHVDFFNAMASGWEYVRNTSLEAQVEPCLRQAQDARLRRPIDVGRYDIVFDGHALANQMHLNLAPATQLDRAMGYTANTVGTSYLNDPLRMLGTYKLGSSLMNVTANRSMPGGCATVKWDDEGVEPEDVVLVKDGILTDFQTTRESASWLKDYYAKVGKPVRSHGGMKLDDIIYPPAQGAHNLMMAPSARKMSFEDLVSGVKRGLAVFGGGGSSDQQALNTESGGDIVYEIVNGKLGRVMEGGIILTRAPDFWKNLVGLGDASTVRRGSAVGWGGAMPQYYTITAPAALINGVAVTVNFRRS